MDSPWQYITLHHAPCKVIEEETLWGQTVCRVWLPNQDAMVRVPRAALRSLEALPPELETWRIAYVSAAAKVAEVLEGSADADADHVLLAPMEAQVIPLPHQIYALSRAVSGDRVRYLLADEVGLGKTIEAGLIMRELKLRGLVRRTLVVAPKGIAPQWVAEMRTHFNEPFQLVQSEDVAALRRMSEARALEKPSAPRNSHSNPWLLCDQAIVTLDSVKPLDKRRGWSAERVAEYNRARFEDLVTAGWDLVIVDEAHRLGGSTDQVARYKLGKGLAEAAPYVLLLSATPHQGKSDAFHRLMSLLDERAFPDMDSVSRERVAPYVIRTEKRRAIDADGKPLFKPRRTRTAPVSWEERHQAQRLLYEAVTDYVREGYNQALLEKKRHIGFLMILMQRLVVSSTRAIRTTLERRLEALLEGQREAGGEAAFLHADIYDMDAQELLEELLQARIAALKGERGHVETLLEAARRCEQAGPDAKAEALMDWIYDLQAEENEPELKLLVFTEFVPTQMMLAEFLEARGIPVAVLNGSMKLEERLAAQEAFRDSRRVLVATDAGGEGLNLQFAHVVVNYDMPWNPMRLEQRIGRVDRIGQPRTVRAVNFVFEDSVEFRVLEVLERKLAVIFDEFGIDKTGDVLDSAEAGEVFEEAFAAGILDPEGIENAAEQAAARLRDEIFRTREASPLYGISAEPDVNAAERLRSHPLPHWVERMTVGFLNAHGGAAERKLFWWDLAWPDGLKQPKAVFSAAEAARLTGAALLNLENSRVRGLALNLPWNAPGLPVPRIGLGGLPEGVSGAWGLFEIRLLAGTRSDTRFLRIPAMRRGYAAVFLSDAGKLFLPTARHIWDALQGTEAEVLGFLDQEESEKAHNRLLEAAEQAGREAFETLRQTHLAAVAREEERGTVFFASRRRAIERLGLPEVRRFRLARCDAEEAEWRRELQAARELVPEIRALLVMKIEPEKAHE